MTFYKGWDGYQRELIQAIAPLTPEQLALPVAPTHWPIGMLVQHILNDRIWWFTLWMGEGSPEVAAFMHWEEEEEGKGGAFSSRVDRRARGHVGHDRGGPFPLDRRRS